MAEWCLMMPRHNIYAAGIIFLKLKANTVPFFIMEFREGSFPVKLDPTGRRGGDFRLARERSSPPTIKQ